MDSNIVSMIIGNELLKLNASNLLHNKIDLLLSVDKKRSNFYFLSLS